MRRLFVLSNIHPSQSSPRMSHSSFFARERCHEVAHSWHLLLILVVEFGTVLSCLHLSKQPTSWRVCGCCALPLALVLFELGFRLSASVAPHRL